MNIIITAGGTNEKIDNVRMITNLGTGKLGSIIADKFYEDYNELIENLFYICSNQAGDKEQLFHIAELARDKLKVASLTVLADKGYYTASEFAKCKDYRCCPYCFKSKKRKISS
jgi:hypothetical protein